MRKKFFFPIFLLILLLLSAEIILRVGYYQIKSKQFFAISYFVYHIKLIFPNAININELNDIYGVDNKKNTSVKHSSPGGDFDVVYQTNGDGCRITPSPDNSKGDILIVGGSFTFGWGVEDNENYPYILGYKYWKSWKVINKGVNGWGTANSYSYVLNYLKTNKKPALIIYSMIPSHVTRNYLYKDHIFKDTKQRPHFEIENGLLIYKGISSYDKDSLSKKNQDIKYEMDISVSLIQEMLNISRKNKCEFALVLLPDHTKNWSPSFIKALVDKKINFIDLSHLAFSHFPNDFHPSSHDHLIIAKALSQEKGLLEYNK